MISNPTPSRRRRRRPALTGITPAEVQLLEQRQLLSAVPTRPHIDTPGANPSTLTWTADATAARYEIWINNLSTAESAVVHQTDLTTAAFNIPRRTDDGRYRVWVRGINENGNGPWSAPKEFNLGQYSSVPGTTDLTGPAAANSEQPARFEWNAISNATHYELWVTNLTTGERAVIHERQLTTASFETAEPLPVGRYRAWVRASNPIGRGSWSSASTFQVQSTDSPPAAPDVRLGDRPTTIVWPSVEGASRYEVWANNLTTGESKAVHSHDLQATSFQFSRRQDAGRYRVWVRAANSTGIGRWSQPVDVVVAGGRSFAPPQPEVTEARLIDGDGTIEINWQAGQATAETGSSSYYELWVSSRSSNARVFYQRNLTVSKIQPDVSFEDGEYRAWVRAYNPFGRSRWSAAFDFQIQRPQSAPATPVIIDVQLRQDRRLMVELNSSSNADTFDLVFLDSDEAVLRSVQLPAESDHRLFVDPARRGARHGITFLRIRGTNLLGAGLWSDLFRMDHIDWA